MNNNFWEELKRKNQPILALAPMAGIADSAFRQICKEFGADVLYSEMASATAMNYDPTKTLELAEFDEKERPYVVQLFGGKPADFALAARIITEKIRPDGIDINFGCPVKKVMKQGAGAILMNDLKKSREIIETTLANTDLPVSVKIRKSAGERDALEFLDNIGDLPVAAVMIHGRTLGQGFAGEADLEIVKKARDHFGGVILANGGINNAEQAEIALAVSGADGLGIARGALGKPWIFHEIKTMEPGRRSGEKKEISEIAKIALKHSELAHKLKGKTGIMEMRKHLCWYVQGFSGAKRLREEFVKAENFKDIKNVFDSIAPR